MAKQVMTFYHDEDCKNRCKVNESGMPLLEWGETVPGKIKTKTLYGVNESKDRIILRQPYTLDESLKITDYSVSIQGGEKGFVSFELVTKNDAIDSINTDWGFDVLVGG